MYELQNCAGALHKPLSTQRRAGRDRTADLDATSLRTSTSTTSCQSHTCVARNSACRGVNQNLILLGMHVNLPPPPPLSAASDAPDMGRTPVLPERNASYMLYTQNCKAKGGTGWKQRSSRQQHTVSDVETTKQQCDTNTGRQTSIYM